MEEENNKKEKKKWFKIGVTDRLFFDHLPFILTLTGLAIIYITNTYQAESKIREVEEIKKLIIKEKNEFVLTKTKVSLKGQRSEINKMADSLQLIEADVPPYVINLNSENE